MRRALHLAVSIALAVASVLLLLSACSRITVAAPEGFAPLEEGGSFRAISPEGMLYRVRSFQNEPEKDLEFWSDALENHLQKEGYRRSAESGSFHSGKREGRYFEWVLPYGNESYLYLTALLVTDRTITLAEAAAPHTIFSRYRDSLLESLATIRTRR